MSLFGADGRLARVRDAIKMPKLPSWWKRQDATAERAAVASQIHPMLIAGFFIAAYSAAFVEVCFMFLRVVRMVGDYRWKVEYRDAAAAVRDAATAGWNSELSFTIHPALAVVLFLASAVVVWFSMLWIPGQLAMRGQGRLRRLTLVIVGILCNLYILANVIVGGQANRTEDLRDAISIQQQAGQSRAQIEARIADIDTELDRLCDRGRNNDYNAAACNAGEAAYRATALAPDMLAREEPARRRIIERAVQSAIRADALRAERRRLRDDLSSAPTEAATAVNLTDDAGEGMAVFARYADAYQYVALGLSLSLVAIFGNLWGLGLVQARALLDPNAPVREAAAAARAAENANADGSGAADEPVSDLDLPPLPAPAEDPAFDGVSATVDEHGRRLRRVAGSFRPERDAPRARTDKRRAPDDDAPPMSQNSAADEGPAGAPQSSETPESTETDGIDDLLNQTIQSARNAERERETAK